MLTKNLKRADVDFFENSTKGLNDENRKIATDIARQCVDANQKFVDDNGGLEGVEHMFSEYIQAKVDTAVSAAVSAAVSDAIDATQLADRDKSDRQALDLILGFAQKCKQSFEDALAESNLAADVKQRVHNLYLAQAQ